MDETPYSKACREAMESLAQDHRVIFVGQAVAVKGTALRAHFVNIDPGRLIEVPVFEDTQAGMCLGLALTGYVPVCVFPRWNFAILAANQIVNHMDKWESMGGGKPHIIIRVAVGRDKPQDPGHQHKADYSEQFLDMCKHCTHHWCYEPDGVHIAYSKAISVPRIHIITEYGQFY
jgi:pyruvate/2-oxoglutarate/acetoin dehydrogenase E1 component